MHAAQIIKDVHLTEKTQILGDEEAQYTFVVNPKADKKQIKRAVEELFERQVKSVNVMNVRGKRARMTRFGVGRKANWKKAIVTLADGQEPIELF